MLLKPSARLVAALAVAGGSLLLSGCGAAQEAQPAAAAVMTLHASEAEDLGTLDAVAAKSEAAVYFTAAGNRIETIEGLPFTVTTVTVTDSQSPDVATGTQLEIRQTGQAGAVVLEGAPAFLEEGQSYAGFLQRFHFAEGDDTGQWIITGDGVWQEASGSQLQTTSDESTLPTTLTDSEFEEAASE